MVDTEGQGTVPVAQRVMLHLAQPGLYCASLGEAASEVLSEQERSYWRRCTHARRREEYLCGRVLMRKQLGERLGIAADQLTLGVGEHGRPHCLRAQRAGLSFNLSHTEGLLVLAVGERQLGVDLEHRPRSLDLGRLGRRHFRPEEQSWVDRGAGTLDRQRFFALWTLKEAYMKARGLGFALPSTRFAFAFDEEDKVSRFWPESGQEAQAQRWRFELLRPTVTHQLGLAILDAPQLALETHWWTSPPAP